MALKGFLALVDEKLSEAYHYVAPDKTKHRKPFLSSLDKALANFNEGKQRGGASSMWSANNNVVHFTPKLPGGAPVKVEGKTDFYIPAERFASAIGELRKEVEAGNLDDALHEAYEGVSKAQAREPRGDSRMGSVRAGWSDARRAKFAETQAKKQAAKTK